MEYTDENRSQIQYIDCFKQPLLFEGMLVNKIYPTDIDAFTEYHNKLFIVMEVKGENVPLNYGQSTCLCRIVDALADAGKTAILYICRHTVKDKTQPIYLKDTIVTKAYYKGCWYDVKSKKAIELWTDTINLAKRLEEQGKL